MFDSFTRSEEEFRAFGAVGVASGMAIGVATALIWGTAAIGLVTGAALYAAYRVWKWLR
jgi:hypothetical protein